MFSFPDAAKTLGISPQLLKASLKASGASIDTRTLQPGDLFIALRGENQDGHKFLETAFQKGASGALILKEVFESQKEQLLGHSGRFHNLLPVDNPAEALAKLAQGYRSQFKIPFVGVTGSVGKTSTKEFLYYLLSKKSAGFATTGNLNNHLGLPLTLLRLDQKHQFCVTELGANHPGEIRFLAEILKPTAGIITQIAPVHVEGFGSLEAIYDAKLELFSYAEKGMPGIFPDDDEWLLQKASRFPIRIVRVGKSEKADYRISDVECREGKVWFCLNQKKRFAFPGLAAFLVQNAAMALAMADQLGVSWNGLPEVWDDFKLPAGRFQLQELPGGIHAIFDGYNASPKSFEAALEVFNGMKVKGRKILVFSDMLELGPDEEKYHQDLGRKIAQGNFDCVLAYGSRSKWAIEALVEENSGILAQHFQQSRDVVDFLGTYLRSEDWILLKASRGMKIEEVLKGLSDSILSVIADKN